MTDVNPMEEKLKEEDIFLHIIRIMLKFTKAEPEHHT